MRALFRWLKRRPKPALSRKELDKQRPRLNRKALLPSFRATAPRTASTPKRESTR